jgi:hypothetical protein
MGTLALNIAWRIEPSAWRALTSTWSGTLVPSMLAVKELPAGTAPGANT